MNHINRREFCQIIGGLFTGLLPINNGIFAQEQASFNPLTIEEIAQLEEAKKISPSIPVLELKIEPLPEIGRQKLESVLKENIPEFKELESTTVIKQDLVIGQSKYSNALRKYINNQLFFAKKIINHLRLPKKLNIIFPASSDEIKHSSLHKVDMYVVPSLGIQYRVEATYTTKEGKGTALKNIMIPQPHTGHIQTDFNQSVKDGKASVTRENSFILLTPEPRTKGYVLALAAEYVHEITIPALQNDMQNALQRAVDNKQPNYNLDSIIRKSEGIVHACTGAAAVERKLLTKKQVEEINNELTNLDSQRYRQLHGWFERALEKGSKKVLSDYLKK